MKSKDIKEIVSWYLECKDVLNKVQTLYKEYLNIGYQDSAYKEINDNYKYALKELRRIVK